MISKAPVPRGQGAARGLGPAKCQKRQTTSPPRADGRIGNVAKAVSCSRSTRLRKYPQTGWGRRQTALAARLRTNLVPRARLPCWARSMMTFSPASDCRVRQGLLRCLYRTANGHASMTNMADGTSDKGARCRDNAKLCHGLCQFGSGCRYFPAGGYRKPTMRQARSTA